MKLTSLFPALLLFLLFTSSKPAAQDQSTGGRSQWCRGDDTDSADCTTPPRATYSPQPEYPDSERNKGHEGTVEVSLIVDGEGVTHDIAVSRSLSPAFDAAATKAVSKWKFSPATRNGKPISMRIAVHVEFHTIGSK
jgi:periplasmic protein TonB